MKVVKRIDSKFKFLARIFWITFSFVFCDDDRRQRDAKCVAFQINSKVSSFDDQS